MKRSIFAAAVVGAIVSVSAVAAWAQGPGGMHHHQMSFQDLDADGNGEISAEEMSNHRAARFSKADTNGDGVLSREEMEAAGQKHVQARVGKMLERFDANKDGSLSMDEMPSKTSGDRAGKMFGRMDSDQSGGISEAEFDAARANMGKHKMHKDGKNCMSDKN